jgi:hypothetical protein
MESIQLTCEINHQKYPTAARLRGGVWCGGLPLGRVFSQAQLTVAQCILLVDVNQKWFGWG